MKISLLSIYPDLQSFGIRSISACLKREGHDVDLIFLQEKEFTERYEKIYQVYQALLSIFGCTFCDKDFEFL